jgi:putative transferase (TIGR04331 family)
VKMFLATTANQNYWKKNEKILFLGEWCMSYDQQHIWSKLDHEIIPSHWDEWEKLDERSIYLESIYEKYLRILASNLNDFHNEDHSLRYWRIIIGPWLRQFVDIIYDKYLSIKSAIESNKASHTWIPRLNPAQWVSADTITFNLRANSNNGFNLFLYSRIITQLGQIPFEYKDEKSFSGLKDPVEVKSLALPAKTKIIIKSLLRRISRRIPDRFNQVVFSASGLSTLNLFKLQLSLGQFPYLELPYITERRTSIKENLRKSIKLSSGASELESILNSLIIEQLPTSFLEGYSSMRDKSLEAYPKHPKVIFTSNDSATNEGFKFWVAAQTEQGAKLTLAQHGGGYGMIGGLTKENHELEICDKYFTWGWTLKDQPKIVPMTGGKLQDTKYSIKPDFNGVILWVKVSWPSFFVHMDLISGGLNGSRYLLRQARFLKVIFPEVAKILSVRFPSYSFGLSEEKRFANIFPSIKIYKGAESMYSQLRNSRLCIHDYLGTTWLETLSMNFPTVIFWDPKSVNILKSTQPFLDDLRRVGILHDTPESAAKLVNEIYEDPMSWWSSSDIQEVREKLCHQFARTSDEWLSQWKEELLKIAGSPKSLDQ